jgi:hypothetical protein
VSGIQAEKLTAVQKNVLFLIEYSIKNTPPVP